MNHTKQPKKLLIMNILDILRRYTDANHRLSQKEIADILKKEYNMTADRKAIRRNILNLMDCGYQIEYSESVRMVSSKTAPNVMEESYIWSDFYLVREFTDGELSLLVDSLLFSNHVSYSQCRELVRKLEGLSSQYFHSRIQHIARQPNDSSGNQQLFLNIELLNEAISQNRKVSFRYTEYSTDKKIYPRKRPNGTVREYIVTPYQMAAKEGKYYLICNHDKYDNSSNYRLDRIRDLNILKEPGKPFSGLKDANGNSLDLGTYMAQHPYMFSGENTRIRMRIVKSMVSDVIDLFGKDAVFSDEDDRNVTVTVYANEMATEQFARTYAPDVIVLEPQLLADRIRAIMEESLRKYEVLLEGRK